MSMEYSLISHADRCAIVPCQGNPHLEGGMSTEPWTIESIRDALGNPDLAQRFLGEINKAPAHQLLTVFAKWERIAKDLGAAADRGRDLAVHDPRGEHLPGRWADRTDRILEEAARVRARGAA